LTRPIHLSILAQKAGICRLPSNAGIPAWAGAGEFASITRTSDELSIICPEDAIPSGIPGEKAWRVMKLEGPFEFSEIGILAAILEPLARAGISILAVSTFDTDYVLVKEDCLARAREVLIAEGFIF
jgi:hypothetical protein